MRTAIKKEMYPKSIGTYYDVIMLMSIEDYRNLEKRMDLSNNTINQCQNNNETCYESIKG